MSQDLTSVLAPRVSSSKSQSQKTDTGTAPHSGRVEGNPALLRMYEAQRRPNLVAPKDGALVQWVRALKPACPTAE